MNFNNFSTSHLTIEVDLNKSHTSIRTPFSAAMVLRKWTKATFAHDDEQKMNDMLKEQTNVNLDKTRPATRAKYEAISAQNDQMRALLAQVHYNIKIIMLIIFQKDARVFELRRRLLTRQ